MTLILTIDIGNSNIALGGFEGEALSFVAKIATDMSKTPDEYAAKMIGVLALHSADKPCFEGAIVSSVVPALNAIIREAVRLMCGVTPLFVGPGIKTGVNIQCDDPSSVGADLICACVAVGKLYKSPAIVIDMGTATKMTLVGKNGAFSGVSIMPGAFMGLKALSDGTAQLPQISLEAPASVIGKNTVDCMKSGVVFGNAAMLDGMIDRFCDEFGAPLSVIATGGFAPAIVSHCKHEMMLDEELILKGLNILYQKNN